jgi:hypothetical protein
MPAPDPLGSLQPRRLADAELAAMRQPYEALIGIVPPGSWRARSSARLDPELPRLQEAARGSAPCIPNAST